MIIVPICREREPNSFSISSTAKNDDRCLNKNIESAIAIHAKIMAEIEITLGFSYEIFVL
jgi:hypothetical protein